MALTIYGFELQKTGKSLEISRPGTDWYFEYNLDTEVGELQGTEQGDPENKVSLELTSLEDIDQMLKLLKMARVMIEQNRGDGAEKPDDFYEN